MPDRRPAPFHEAVRYAPPVRRIRGFVIRVAIFLRGGFLDVKGWRERCDGVVWHDYVAGTDPTNGQSKFTATIEMKDSETVVTVEMT